MAKEECRKTFDSFYDKSSLYLLYGGMRKTLFVKSHPLGGLSSVNVGIKVGKAFFDLNKQQLEYKESGWRVKMNFGGTNLFNLKRKVGAKVKGQARHNIQFGTDSSHFSSCNAATKFSVGGMYLYGVGGLMTATRVKFFSDQAMELFTEATVAGLRVGCDVRAEEKGYKGFCGASYGFPKFPVLQNVHVGSVVAFESNLPVKPSVGLFAELPLQPVKKVIVGMELFPPKGALFGTEVVFDDENSVIAKVSDNGVAHISFLKHFKGIDLRMGIEANANSEKVFGKFGAQVKLKQ